MITLSDIAREVNLNVSVVSRALHPGAKRHPVKKETRELVIAAANRLGYRPNRQASFLKKGSSATIFCFLPDFACRLLGDLMYGISEAACAENFPVNFSFGQTVDDFRGFFDMLGRVRHSAVLTYPPPAHSDYPVASRLRDLPRLPDDCRKLFVDYHKNGGHLVLLNQSSNIAACDDADFRKLVTLDIDDYHGGKLVAEHFIRKGCQRFFHCRSGFCYQRRHLGFAETLEAAGHRSEDLTYGLLKTLADAEEKAGIFAAHDFLAYDVHAAMRELHIEAGKRVLLSGFDDEFSSAFSVPSLTTVHQPTREEGRRALRKLINMINGDGETGEMLKPRLVLRETTGDVAPETMYRPRLPRE